MNDMTIPPLLPDAESVDYDPFATPEVLKVVPTTEAQREIWLADRISPDASLAYNESVSLVFDGELDVSSLARALQGLTERHEALRSNIGPEGTELYVAAMADLALDHVDLSGLAPAEADARVQALRAEAVERHFDLGAGMLFRATLVELGPQRHELILSAHHIVCDGWSFGILASELMQLYRALQNDAADPLAMLKPTLGFGDYARAQSQPQALRQQAADEQYWVAKYDKSVPTIDLPTDRVRAALRTFGSRHAVVTYDAARLERLRRFGSANGATLFATLLGVFAGMVGRLGGHEDVAIGIPVAGQLADGHDSLVGHCVNLLPIRVDVAMDKEARLLVQAASTALLDAFDHSNVTLGSLLRRLQVPRDPSRVPLVPVMFNVETAISSAELSMPALQVQVITNPRHFENAELFLNVVQDGGALTLECQYNASLFDDETVLRWLDLYCTALDRCTAGPAAIAADVFAPTAREAAMLQGFNSLTQPVDLGARIENMVDAQVHATPDAVAVSCADRSLSYREFARRANGVAAALRDAGAGVGDLVGICCERSELMVPALHGILKSGAGFVPLEPSLPAERLDFMAGDAGLRHIVVDDATAARWQASGRALVNVAQAAPQDASPPHAGTPEDLAYVIYTSGSTGKPKGVRVPHRTVVNLMHVMRTTPGMKREHSVLALTTLAFDLAVFEDILPLTLGARIVVAERGDTTDGERLRALIEREGVTCMGATPSTWRLLLSTGWQGRPDLLAKCCGEPLSPELARELLPCVGTLWNGYGPTENTMATSFYRVQEPLPAIVPIGKPLPNVQMHVLDAQQRPLPIGVVGEICLSGANVTLGYLNREELTAKAFVNAPSSDGGPALRVYRSGDYGRWLANGNVECLGRADQQVKIRGYRIELGEIEATLAAHPAVERTIVITREDRPGDVRIVAYVVARDGQAMPDAGELRSYLGRTLPAYMIPQHFMPMKALPLFASGKVDLRALPAPDAGQAGQGTGARVAPRDADEALALQAMEETLNLPGLGIDDDFFSLGGHSLLAARLTARLNRDLNIQLPFRTLFESPTARKLAVALAAARDSDRPRRQPLRRKEGRTRARLTPMQERICFMEQLYPGRPVYNAPSGHRLTGPLDVQKFHAAFQHMMQRQHSLRTYIDTDAEGNHVQVVADEVALDMPLVDLSHLPQEEREARLLEEMQQVADGSMDIHQAPLFRSALFKLGEEEHAFVYVPHHLIWDGWSFDLLQAELAAIYGAMVRGEPLALPVPAVNYGDYAEWFNDWLEGDEYAAQLRFWKERFANAPVPVTAQTDKPRGSSVTGDGRSQWVTVGHDATETMREIARGADATLNMLMMSVYSLMMSKAIGTDSVVVAVPVRGREAPELETVMGFFTNLLLVQLRVDESMKLMDYVRYVKQELLAVTTHALVPFERVVAEPEVSARIGRAGSYHALFSFQDARERPRDFGAGLQHKQIHLRQRGATDDLGLWLMDKPHGLEGALIYNADVYLSETGEAFRVRFDELLQRVLANPDTTLAELGDPAGSAAAQVLSRLRADASKPSDAELRLAAQRGEDAPQLLMPEQAQLAQIWASVLSIDVNDIHPTDNFFDLGGDSLLAMRAMQQAERTLGARPEARRYVFESLAQLAADLRVQPAAVAAVEEAAAAAAAAAPTQEKRGLLGRVASAFGRK